MLTVFSLKKDLLLYKKYTNKINEFCYKIAKEFLALLTHSKVLGSIISVSSFLWKFIFLSLSYYPIYCSYVMRSCGK